MCQVSGVIYICFCDKLVELDGGGSVINKAYLVYFLIELFWYKLLELVGEGSFYQRGLPGLVIWFIESRAVEPNGRPFFQLITKHSYTELSW